MPLPRFVKHTAHLAKTAAISSRNSPKLFDSGTLFYDYVTTNLYAVVYTALPILLYGIYDRDISAETCLR